MNLKLAKKIRQGMREMAQAGAGAISGRYPEDYEGVIPRKGLIKIGGIFHHDYLHWMPGGLWATQETSADGSTTLQPLRISARLKLISARQVYKRAKRMVCQ